MRQLGDTKTPLVAQQYEYLRLCRQSRARILVAALRDTASALLQPIGGRSVLVRDPAALGLIPLPTLGHGTAMFRIVLQPEEAALLCAIRDGLCPADEVPGSALLSLMALRMLKCDEHGNPTLTDLAEAALQRMSGKLH